MDRLEVVLQLTLAAIERLPPSPAGDASLKCTVDAVRERYAGVLYEVPHDIEDTDRVRLRQRVVV